MKLKIKKMDPNAKMPTKGSAQAAAFDFYALLDRPITIWPGETAMVRTGISAEIPEGYFMGIYARSGLACKQGIRLANSVAVIDSDYRGEIMVALHNDSNSKVKIMSGDRIAQMIIQPCPEIELEEADALSETERGSGGFGSTGIGCEEDQIEVAVEYYAVPAEKTDSLLLTAEKDFIKKSGKMIGCEICRNRERWEHLEKTFSNIQKEEYPDHLMCFIAYDKKRTVISAGIVASCDHWAYITEAYRSEY